MYHGIINVYKEKGFTSHDVVAKLRGICKQKKIGHTGTLDPEAVGVLPVCLGSATKLCDMLTDKNKEYVAVLRLGIVTDTQDLTGTVLEEHPVTATEEQIRETIFSFQGEQMQVPPMYSALKVNGKKLYELAREGKEVERAARPITIHEIDILKEELPEITIRVSCSKGTYIRTLCHDIGQALLCGGAMASLTRTRVGSFPIEQSYPLAKLQQLSDEGRLSEAVLPVEEVFAHLPVLRVKDAGMKALLNGNQLKKSELEAAEGKPWGAAADQETAERREAETVQEAAGYRVRIHGLDDRFYGIYEYKEEKGLYCPVKMFFPE